MKKLFGLLLFIASAQVFGQVWTPIPDAWLRLDGGLAVPSGYLTIKDETTARAQQSTLTFLGSGVSCVNNAGNFATECTIGSGSGYSLVRDEATPLTARANLTFLGTGVTCVDDAGADLATECTITSGGVTDADFLVGTAHAGLSAEIVVGTSPGGELGNTWASPTIDDSLAVTNWTLTTPTIAGAIVFPDGTRQAFNPDGTTPGLSVGSQAGDPSAPSNGDLWYDSTANELTARINGANVALQPLNSLTRIEVWDDFTCGAVSSAATAVGSCIGLTAANAGSAAAGTLASEANHPGIGFVGTSASATARCTWIPQSSVGSVILSGGETFQGLVRIPNESTGTETFEAYVGLIETTGGQARDNGCYFTHFDDDVPDTPNWQINVEAAGALSTADSGVDMAENTWTTLKVVSESGVGCHFYINGTETSNSPINTNIPSNPLSFGFMILKSVGTTDRRLHFDYVDFYKNGLSR